MAEASASRVGGFTDVFVRKVDEELHCLICQLPMKKPVQTKCGHRFCGQCLDKHLRGRSQRCCPVNRTNLNLYYDIFSDKAIEKKILALIIRCPNKGCPWTGELISKDDHLASECQLVMVSCPYAHFGCSKKIPRGEVESHLQSTVRNHLELADVALKNQRSQVDSWKIAACVLFLIAFFCFCK